MKKTVLLILFLLFSAPVFCQEWVSQYQEAQSSYTNGDYEQALEVGKQSLSGYLEADGSLNNNYASILRLLTTTCYEGEFYDQGLAYAEKEIQVRKAMGEDQNLEFATSLYNLGSFYEIKKDAEAALEAFKKANAIYDQFYQADNPNVINCKWKIAANLVSLKKNDEALAIYEGTIPLFDTSEGVTMDYVNASNDYANILIDKKQYEKALPYLNDLEDIYSSLGSEYDLLLAQVFTNAGLCQNHAQAFEQAESAYAQASQLYDSAGAESKALTQLKNLRAINYKSLGEEEKAAALLAEINDSGDASTKASALNNEAILKQQSGQYAEAKDLLISAISQLSNGENSKPIALAETLDNLSSVYLMTGRSDSAKYTAERAIQIKSEIQAAAPGELAISINKLGEAQQALGQWEMAIQNYEKAAKMLEQGDPIKYASVLGNMAIYYQDRGDYAKAENLFIKQTQLIKAHAGENSMAYATVINNQATLKQIQAEYFGANSLLHQSLTIIEEHAGKNSLSYVGVAENLALVEMQLGNYQLAESALKNTLQVRKSILGDRHPLYANALQNMGRLKQQQGKYQEAEPCFSEALEIKKSVFGQNHPEYAHALNNMALLYQTMGNFTKSEQLFSEALSVYANAYGKQHPEYATALENLATLKKLKGLNNEAVSLLNEALQIDKQTLGQNHPRYAITLHNLASAYKDLKQYEKAAGLFKEALNIDRQVFGEEHPAYASTLYNLAVLQQELKEIDAAETNFIKALNIRKKTLGESHPDYAYSLYGLAGLYHLTGEYKKAQKYYEQVVHNYLRQIEDFFPSLSEKEKSAFYGKIKPVIESFQDFAVSYATSNPDSAATMIGELYDLQLSTKALLLHASNTVRNRIFNSGNETLISNYEQWTEMKEQLSKYLSYTPEELKEQRINVSALADEINDVEKFLSQQSELFAKEIDNEGTSWHQIQDVLKEDEAAVEIIRIKKRYIPDSVMYVALILKTSEPSPELVILNEGVYLENRFFNYYRNAIKFTVGDEISFKQFWAPIDAKLKGINQVYASADGVFNKININTLYDSEKGKYVIDSYNVRSVSNTREVVSDRPQGNAENIAAVFGYPDFNLGLEAPTVQNTTAHTRASEFGFSDLIPDLPGTKTEVQELNKILTNNGWKTNLFTRADATEKQVKQIHNPKVLHVATHGFFMQDIDFNLETDYGLYFNNKDYNPLFRSGLLLAGAAGSIYKDHQLDDEDGILTAYEAMNLNLEGTSLVVLSACETGVGEVKNGEGVYGLQRAFLVAGAESVIMSLWQVDDYTTQRLMVLFYNNWLSGQNKFDAFKNAEKKLKEEFKDPFHWGAFVILGVE